MKPAEVPSPCTGVCRLDAADVCIGCGRTLGEIAQWSEASDPRKLQIRAQAAERLVQTLKRSTSS